jgi:hypothetical protein
MSAACRSRAAANTPETSAVSGYIGSAMTRRPHEVTDNARVIELEQSAFDPPLHVAKPEADHEPAHTHRQGSASLLARLAAECGDRIGADGDLHDGLPSTRMAQPPADRAAVQ